jgi:hypothetical protein
MNVNIVSPWSLQFDHILRRMTAALPWPVTDRPKPGALNYFFPYQFYQYTGGRTASLFSHNMGHEKWEEAALCTDMRLAWTELYTRPLATYGKTRRVIPGLDHDAFTPGKPRKKQWPVIGVSGIVYGDGRKGEDLWARLVGENEPGMRYLQAAGQGWAGDCKDIPHKDMPEFYRGLRVFLCCSRVEGVPMPPLEALACGVSVVIPDGVGLLDELPDTPGIHRFTAGNYASMITAIVAAFEADADPEQLRAAVSGYTNEAWIDSHMAAFEEFV